MIGRLALISILFIVEQQSWTRGSKGGEKLHFRRERGSERRVVPIVIVYNVYPAPGLATSTATAPRWTTAPFGDVRRPLEQRRFRRATAVRRRVTGEHRRPLGTLDHADADAYAETKAQTILLLLEEVGRPVSGRLRVQLFRCPRSPVRQHRFWLVTRARAIQRDVRLKRRVEVVLSGGRDVVHALVRRPCVLYHVGVPGAQGAHAAPAPGADHSASAATEQPHVTNDANPLTSARPDPRATAHSTATLAHTAVHSVALVLQPRLLVRFRLLPLLPPLHAHHGDGRDQDERRHGRGQRGDHHHVLGGEARVPGLRGRGRHVPRQISRPVTSPGRRDGRYSGCRCVRRSWQRDRPAPYLVCASVAVPTVCALAKETVHAVHARAAIPAWRASTLVHVHAAILARESRLARAPIIVRTRYATATIRARFREAVIHLVLAQPAHVSRHALATELID